jgi:hypothetical protein
MLHLFKYVHGAVEEVVVAAQEILLRVARVLQTVPVEGVVERAVE